MQAISSLAEAAYDTVEIPEDAIDDQPETYCLSSLYNALMTKVLEVTQRYVINMSSHIISKSVNFVNFTSEASSIIHSNPKES